MSLPWRLSRLDHRRNGEQALHMAFLLTVAFFALSIAISWRLGGDPERRGAQVVLMLLILGLLRTIILGTKLSELDVAGLVLDTCAMAAFVWIALFAWRFWPLWASALQLLAVMAHVTRAFDIPIHPIVYAILRTVPTYMLPLILLIATIRYRQVMRKNGKSLSWRNWSGRLNHIAPSRLPSAY
jgi:hypothetical protein